MARLTLPSGHVVLFDEADAALVGLFRWHVSKEPHTNYAIARPQDATGKRRIWQMHALIMGVKDVDHRNGNGLDNRRDNLRVATRSQQLANSRHKEGTSDFRGVHWVTAERKWAARIKVDGRTLSLGRYADEEDAARAYDAAALAAWGEFARPNFPR